MIYDDLMLAKPGGYQGVYLQEDDPRIMKIFRKVPIFIFKRNEE